jgi:hypothetical protein
MGYEVLGPASTLVCLAMVTISIIRMVAGVMVRMIIIITKVKKGGIWILGAIWDMAFLVAISPVLWAMECGRQSPITWRKEPGGFGTPRSTGPTRSTKKPTGRRENAALERSGGVCHGVRVFGCKAETSQTKIAANSQNIRSRHEEHFAPRKRSRWHMSCENEAKKN